ncbi:MAG: hypothetical protein Q7K28_02430, partial [Candidatus Wildermuthbacteria bacterium]|nr:hypothetical protein [Candidatus Wildermuthbacteria bacterium]
MPQEYQIFLLQIVWKLIRAWWWVPLPFLLWKPATYLWLWWRTEIWKREKFKPILLEIRIPKESLKPIRAMENVLAGIHQATWEPPNWIEKWWEGQPRLTTHFEIISIGGEIHFYIRVHQKYRDPVEANIYSQYPGAEITLAEDYTKNVPQDMPNKEWDFWGADYKFLKADPYPILTYKAFETETEALEEKRVDPMATLLENFSKVKPGEQFWVQISAESTAESFIQPFLKEGLALRDILAKRPEKPKEKSMIQQGAELLVLGKMPEEVEVKEESVIPPEMKLTPGEKEIVQGIEFKISKPCFNCNTRFIFMGKRDVWFRANMRLIFGYFANFTTLNMNALVPYGKTLTKVKSKPIFNLLDKRRLYLRQRKLLRNYKEREQPYYPLSGRWPAVFVLNTEELASLFHF